jgi:hypothetical protein
MKRMKIPGAIAAAVLILVLTCTTAFADGPETQTFTLKKGWNAVFLEVRPEPRDPATVFADLPLGSSVWTWLSRESSVEYIQDPSEGLWGQPGWHAYFNSPDTNFLTNLYAVLGNQAYLIKVGGSEEITLEIGGTASIRNYRWIADSFNLVGFHVAKGKEPTFEDLLAPSPAHAGQAVWRLNDEDKWEFVEDLAAARPAHGAAYWVYCEGRSGYQGPLEIDLPLSTGLNFGASLTRLTVTLSNLTDSARTVSASLTGDVILYYRDYDPNQGYFTWQSLASSGMPPVTLDPERSRNVWLEVRREQMDAGLYLGTLEITDDMGNRFWVPVSAEEIQ